MTPLKKGALMVLSALLGIAPALTLFFDPLPSPGPEMAEAAQAPQAVQAPMPVQAEGDEHPDSGPGKDTAADDGRDDADEPREKRHKHKGAEERRDRFSDESESDDEPLISLRIGGQD